MPHIFKIGMLQKIFQLRDVNTNLESTNDYKSTLLLFLMGEKHIMNIDNKKSVQK